ncbi:hypothetical protein V2J09_003913 [Rumex salicifolius]
METPSVRLLCKQLISLAIQRCRFSADICRLSVDIRRSKASDLHWIQISISDTGTGSSLEEFYPLKYTFNGVYGTTDDEIYHYKLNLNETSSSRRTTRLSSTSKNNAEFSGTEVSLSCTEDMDALVTNLTHFFQKMLILKPHNIAAELMADIGDHPDLQQHKVIIASDNMYLPLASSSNTVHLKARLEEYVHKHGSYSSEKCQSCFPNSKQIKTGNGVAIPENHTGNQMTVEAVIIISELSETSHCTCSRAQNIRTEVLYFKEYSPSLIHPSVLNSLKSISWDTFGLALSSITTHDGCAVLEWENLPLNYDAPPSKKIARLEEKLIKTSVYAALNDLKEKYQGYLLSAHALKIRSYAPDLARSIAGLISSSKDYDFQGECFSLLGLESGSIEADCVENCIKEKIISALEMNDRKTSRFHDPALSLFEAYSDLQEPNHMEYDFEEGEEGCSFMEN